MNILASSFVDEQRLYARLMAMAVHGATPKGGVNRQALSQEDILAQRQLMQWGAELGMEVSGDPAGNLFLRLEGSDLDAAPVLSGSHLDSQPTGGKFDGVYGVLAALEAVQAIVQAGIKPRRAIEVVAWMNEEGSRFAPGMSGSSAFAGARSLDEVLGVSDAAGVTVKAALSKVREALPELRPRALGGVVFAYVEAHIEQAPQLEREGLTIGVVSGIQGKRTFVVRVAGEASHAGTSTRAERKDALLTAVAIITALKQDLQDTEDVSKFTVGRLTVSPNAPSVVPSDVEFSIDLRHPDSNWLRRKGDGIHAICAALAAPCMVAVHELSNSMSLQFPGTMRARIEGAAARLELPRREILSAAGHDARYLHDVCEAGMIFVPSHLGITHNEAEETSASDLYAGARVLADVLAELAA